MELKFNTDGLIPAIVQDQHKNVLMLAYMNEESLAKTRETGETWFFSRSRQQLWNKGETSGNVQKVLSIHADCDQDALLITVEQIGDGACHEGDYSCFHNHIAGDPEAKPTAGALVLEQLYEVITDRKDNPREGSYTNYLFSKGTDKILKKVGEESAEVIIAAKNGDQGEITYEISDLLYHLLVLLVEKRVRLGRIWEELESRR